ncbi:MAG: chlorite dismutase family protein [Sphaerobacter sp.]|nr:chlorite dismutase family protein [Sphaerobacter sp.]
MHSSPTYTVFWLYKAQPEWRTLSDAERAAGRDAFLQTLDAHRETAPLRAAYSTVGFRADVDLILWAVAQEIDALQQLAVDLNRTPLGQHLEMRQAYLGLGMPSQYDPEHGPAFLRGIPPKRYLSVYPFTKTPEWYLLPFEKRRELMLVHGELGREFPTILTNTVSAFGIADHEFVVALEDDDPATLVAMVQRLRAAEVRIYTKVDTPIFLGRRKDPEEALRDF